MGAARLCLSKRKRGAQAPSEATFHWPKQYSEVSARATGKDLDCLLVATKLTKEDGSSLAPPRSGYAAAVDAILRVFKGGVRNGY